MGSIRDWVIRKLDPGYKITLIGGQGLEIRRPGKPLAKIFCAEPDSTVPFSLEDLEQARKAFDTLDFVVITRRAVDHAVYEVADEVGLCVDTFGELTKALSEDLYVAKHREKDHAYFRQRIQHNPAVKGIKRRGARAFEVQPEGAVNSLIVVTIPDYELTSDGVYEILENYAHLRVDAIVSTNPNATGLAPDALEAGRQTGTRVLVLNELLDQLRDSWN